MKREVAAAVLYDGTGRFLLQLRTSDSPVLPRFWGLFGGKIEFGESPENAIKRELQEELGITEQNPRAWLVQNESSRRHDTKHVFILEVDCERFEKLGEGAGIGWFMMEEIAHLKVHPHDFRILSEADRFVRAKESSHFMPH